MQTLVFNTTTKRVILYKDSAQQSEILYALENVPTVKVLETYYQVMQLDISEKQIPRLRVPVSNTNMVIEE